MSEFFRTFAPVMHFISQIRFNPETKCDEKYYRIKETFRDYAGKIHSRILLNVGFVSGLRPEDIRDIGKGLNYLSEHRGEKNAGNDLFGNVFARYSGMVREHIKKYWAMMVEQGTVDTVANVMEASKEQARKLIDTDSMKHTDAREVGAEWLCLQAIRQLEIDEFLRTEGWSEERIKAAVAMLITRTVYAPSELKSIRIMEENSAVCELVYGEQGLRPGYKAVYKVAPSLYEIKEKLEKHLCSRTDTLFNQKNRILLFDLTNFYFEGRKESSEKAAFGRSKEKRSDCKLLVLALCINTDGFIRYSSVLPGNTADPKSLPDMVEKVIAASPVADDPQNRSLVVIDAGIATEDNLMLIRERGFNYLCVSRSRLTDCKLKADAKTVIVHDCRKQEIRLTEVAHEEGGDYFLQVNSPAKALKESSMNRQFRERFEAELKKIKESIHKKGGVKRYDKVIERTGRAMQKYPSIAKFYTITYKADAKTPSLMSDITWEVKVPDVDADSGKYYLRTNVSTLDEKTTWDYYNLIREIECTNRQLKTDLSLRPIFHQTDERSDAHLFFGLLAYWIVNTIRLQLKQSGNNSYWTEIVRTMSTQKLVTTEATNALGEKVQVRMCSEPTSTVSQIYKALRYKDRPFTRKFVVHSETFPKIETAESKGNTV